MTNNQANVLATKPHTQKALAVLQSFAEVERVYKEQKAKHDEAIKSLLEAMVENDIIKLEGEWGYITRAERTVYSAGDISAIAPEFTKPALDTAKIRASATLTGELPEGVSANTTNYLTKKFKYED